MQGRVAGRNIHLFINTIVTTPAEFRKAVPADLVVAKAPRKPATLVGDVKLTHPEKELWPGITKRILAVLDGRG